MKLFKILFFVAGWIAVSITYAQDTLSQFDYTKHFKFEFDNATWVFYQEINPQTGEKDTNNYFISEQEIIYQYTSLLLEIDSSFTEWEKEEVANDSSIVNKKVKLNYNHFGCGINEASMYIINQSDTLITLQAGWSTVVFKKEE